MIVFKKIFEQPWVMALQDAGGECFVVGGSVRDLFLQKTPKDIDLVVRLLPFNRLVEILNEYGKTDLVGESFSVIKFTYEGEVYDVAIPRRDVKIAGAKGHKSIEAQSDHNLSIEEDLARRDIRMNAMAIGSNLNLIDPFNGKQDIEKGVINCVSEESFIEDPLRMLRALQFAARFSFNISDTTYKLIKENRCLIKEIMKERVFDELEKPFSGNGNIAHFAFMLQDTGLFPEIFGYNLRYDRMDVTEHLSEMLFYGVASPIMKDVAVFYKKAYPNLKDQLLKELKAFDVLCSPTFEKSTSELMFDAMKHSDIVLRSNHVPDRFKEPFLSGDYPCSRKELALSGDELVSMGYKEGKEVGDAIASMLKAVLNRKTINNKESLIKFLERK